MYINLITYIVSQSFSKYHHIFTPGIYVQDAIIVEFALFADDLLINKSAQGFLNCQNPFLWYELISHPIDIWKSENINYDN